MMDTFLQAQLKHQGTTHIRRYAWQHKGKLAEV
jgi:hypothetical protein